MLSFIHCDIICSSYCSPVEDQRKIALISAPSVIFLHMCVPMQGAQLKKHIDATLGSGNLREAVRLPPGEDLNEWLAVNSKKSKPYDFVNYTIICYPVLMSKFRSYCLF